MPDTLQQLVAAARRRVAEARRNADKAELESRAEQHRSRGFRSRLVTVAQQGPAVIAELKKGSPSKGLIREPFHPAALAFELANAGAAALSVLTEEERFLGSLANLCEASAATELPCLRKDFIVDEFQILEARANRADAILLIVAALTQYDLVSLADRARDFGLDVLVEVHDAEELDRAIQAGSNIIGVNNRNLKTFDVDLETSVRLAEKMPKDVVRVAESGIHSASDMVMLRNAGYHAFLIGESLMRAERPGAMLKTMLDDAGSALRAGGSNA